ncbi:hypothetical protein ACFQ93_07255 [Streptomyces sp. NPDC056601]|uniref:hypothetical protein n=1 Tax=Streptomyces sp. NPDC056601 TaxID=3345875 RepID=UPI0036788036
MPPAGPSTGLGRRHRGRIGPGRQLRPRVSAIPGRRRLASSSHSDSPPPCSELQGHRTDVSAMCLVRLHVPTLEKVRRPAYELLAGRSKHARNKRTPPGIGCC